MRAVRLLRVGVALAAIGGVALIVLAAKERIPLPLGMAGAGALFVLVIPLLLFVRLTFGLRAVNVSRTSDNPRRIEVDSNQKVGQNPS